ncbi:MAG: PhoH family protein [Gammaproteobacteria bacterium]|jgi:phosphate starvation-inducible PhoH-like protein|nr:PhoH family protein [Gammaproteobacteria bacterium]
MNSFTLEPSNIQRLQILCGDFDANLHLIEKLLGVEIFYRGNHFNVKGDNTSTKFAEKILHALYEETADAPFIDQSLIHSLIKSAQENVHGATVVFKNKYCLVKARGSNQKKYVEAIKHHPINFGIGPAGTGKTYLAVACAVAALQAQAIQRILLVRPAVEAGEKLGFLPGDLTQKVDPYFRPLYDALYDMLGFEQVGRLLQKNVIEIAPLAYMRGRTLNDAFIILDESQNTTREQMKMFLTRIGFGSTVVITGDMTQVDLPRGTNSGLEQAVSVLENVEGVSISHFTAKDIVRHPIVQAVVEAYENAS